MTENFVHSIKANVTNVVAIHAGQMMGRLDRIARSPVAQTICDFLDAEGVQLFGSNPYERRDQRCGDRSDHEERKLHKKEDPVNVRVSAFTERSLDIAFTAIIDIATAAVNSPPVKRSVVDAARMPIRSAVPFGRWRKRRRGERLNLH